MFFLYYWWIIFKYSLIVYNVEGERMKKMVVCIMSFLSVLIICSVSYQPVIVVQAINTNSDDNMSKLLLNIDNTGKGLSSFLKWLVWVLGRIVNIIWSGILLLLRPILAPIFWILFVIFKLIVPS
jgi:hypothetical protein